MNTSAAWPPRSLGAFLLDLHAVVEQPLEQSERLPYVGLERLGATVELATQSVQVRPLPRRKPGTGTQPYLRVQPLSIHPE